jgi:hypothetical protein
MTKSKLFKELDVEVIGGKELTAEDSKLISNFIKEDKAKRRHRVQKVSKKANKPVVG